jgi:structural maintenance of chromosome 3 (chondroitin sulfate proteoglycan 6)
MPLNRLKSHTVNYPRAQDAVPMITKLKFDRAYIMAFEQVFGRTIICDDLTTAAQYTRSHGLNSVTLEGDRVDRKGALTGGYHDVRRSRLDAVKGVRKWQEVFNTDSARHAEVKSSLSALEQQITTTLGQIQVLEAKRKQLLETRNMVAAAAAGAARDEEAARQRVGRFERDLNDAEAVLRDATAKREGYEEEIQTPMTQRLSDAEVALLEQLSGEVEEQKAALVEASRRRQEVGAKHLNVYGADERSRAREVSWKLS